MCEILIDTDRKLIAFGDVTDGDFIAHTHIYAMEKKADPEGQESRDR